MSGINVMIDVPGALNRAFTAYRLISITNQIRHFDRSIFDIYILGY